MGFNSYLMGFNSYLMGFNNYLMGFNSYLLAISWDVSMIWYPIWFLLDDLFSFPKFPHVSPVFSQSALQMVLSQWAEQRINQKQINFLWEKIMINHQHFDLPLTLTNSKYMEEKWNILMLYRDMFIIIYIYWCTGVVWYFSGLIMVWFWYINIFRWHGVVFFNFHGEVWDWYPLVNLAWCAWNSITHSNSENSRYSYPMYYCKRSEKSGFAISSFVPLGV